MRIIENKRNQNDDSPLYNALEDKRSTSSKHISIYSQFCHDPCYNVDIITCQYFLLILVATSELKCRVRIKKPCFIISSVFNQNDKFVLHGFGFILLNKLS